MEENISRVSFIHNIVTCHFSIHFIFVQLILSHRANRKTSQVTARSESRKKCALHKCWRYDFCNRKSAERKSRISLPSYGPLFRQDFSGVKAPLFSLLSSFSTFPLSLLLSLSFSPWCHTDILFQGGRAFDIRKYLLPISHVI